MWKVLTAEEAYEEFGFEEDAELVLHQSYPLGNVSIWPMPDGRYTVGESESDYGYVSYREGVFTLDQVAKRYGVTRNVLEALANVGCRFK